MKKNDRYTDTYKANPLHPQTPLFQQNAQKANIFTRLSGFYERLMLSNKLGIWRYAITVALCIIALGIRLAIAPVNAGLQFITFFPTVALSAVLYGTGPGLVATLVCVILATFFLFEPYGTFVFDFSQQISLGVFVFIADGIIVSLSIGMMHRYFTHYHQSLSELEELLNQNQQHEAKLNYQKYALDQSSIVAVTDVRGTITYVNDLFCAISQYAAEELLGQNHRLLNSGAHPKQFFTDMYRTIAQGTVWKGDICNRAKDGSLYWVATTIVPYVADNGKPTRYVAIRADITERKKAEQAAQAAIIAKSQFLANMSHEIRTPMNAILGLTRMVMESDLQPEQREQLSKVRKSGQALVRIINDILDFSRIEAGHMTIENVSMRLETVLLDVANLFGALLEEKGLELFIDIHPDTPLLVMGDPLRLTQIINNLLGNAIKFTDHGEIHLGVKPIKFSEASVMLQFFIRDTGIGIADDVLDSLFNPFIQADNSTTRKFGGTGLGLSIVKKLVELMHGEIHVESSLGKGTNIYFTVEVITVLDEVRSLSNFSGDLHNLRGKRVLVVDDQPTSRHILSRLLKIWGLHVVEAESGPEAIIHFDDANRDGQPFYAILLDWRMPGMDGLELAMRLKSAQAEKQSLIVLMVTAYDKQTLIEAPEAVYINGLLTKPVVPSYLFDALLNGTTPRDNVSEQLIAQRFDGMRVLLVEDHDLNQEVASSFMRKRGVTVSVAWHGGEAVELVKQQMFDLVLMDLHMPVMGGIEATKIIRQLPQGKDLPIVAMTAAVLADDRQICQDVGMNDFIPKPVEPEDFVRVLSLYAVTNTETTAINAPSNISVTNPILDLVAGLRRLDDDNALQQRLLLGFIERHHDSIQRLDALLSEKNLSAAIDLIHSLKGIAGNLGAVSLAESCRKLTEEMRGDTPLHTRAEFETTLIETLRQMQVQISKTVPSTPSQTPSVQMSLKETLQALEPFIVGQEIVPDHLLVALHQYSNTDLACSGQLKQVQYHLDNFEHNEAKELFKQLNIQYQGE